MAKCGGIDTGAIAKTGKRDDADHPANFISIENSGLTPANEMYDLYLVFFIYLGVYPFRTPHDHPVHFYCDPLRWQ